MGFFDGVNSAEILEGSNLGGAEYENLPGKKWVIGEVIQEGEKTEPCLETVNFTDEAGVEQEFFRLKVVLKPVGVEAGVEGKRFNSVFVQLSPGSWVEPEKRNLPIAPGDPGYGKYASYEDWSKDTPNPRVVGLACALVAPGVGAGEKDDTTRSMMRKARMFEVLGKVAEQEKVGKGDGNAVALSETLALWLRKNKARVLFKTKIQKGREYRDSKTGELKEGQDRVTVGSFEDCIPGNLEKRKLELFYPDPETPAF
jgi:hypothetical protein